MPARSWAAFDETNSAIHIALILVFRPRYLSTILSSRRKLSLFPFSQFQFFSSAPFLNALTAFFHLPPRNYHPQQAIQTLQTRLWILRFHQLTSTSGQNVTAVMWAVPFDRAGYASRRLFLPG
jgi:hypothetical protein